MSKLSKIKKKYFLYFIVFHFIVVFSYLKKYFHKIWNHNTLYFVFVQHCTLYGEIDLNVVKQYFCYQIYSAMAYGAIGAILGHEMSHGFDNTGRQFDKYGEMNDWWTKSSKEKFNNRTKCMVDQYNEYKVAGGHHVSFSFIARGVLNVICKEHCGNLQIIVI